MKTYMGIHGLLHYGTLTRSWRVDDKCFNRTKSVYSRKGKGNTIEGSQAPKKKTCKAAGPLAAQAFSAGLND